MSDKKEQVMKVLRQLGVTDTEAKADEILGLLDSNTLEDLKLKHQADMVPVITLEIIEMFQKRGLPLECGLTVLANVVAGILYSTTRNDTNRQARFDEGVKLFGRSVSILRNTYEKTDKDRGWG